MDKRKWHLLNIVRTDTATANNGRSVTKRHIKLCYACERKFVAVRRDALACCGQCSTEITRHLDKHGVPPKVFTKKELEKADTSPKKDNEAMGATAKKEATPKEKADNSAFVKQIFDMDDEVEADMQFMEGVMKRNPKTLGMAAAPHKHFRVARNIVINFYNRHGFKEVEAIHEMAADTSDLINTKIVDVGFIDAFEKNLVAVEVDTGLDVGKVATLRRNGFREIFYYLYEIDVWTRFTDEPKVKQEGVSKSKILGIDLADYIDLPK